MHVLLDSSLLQMGLIFRVKSILEPKLETFMFSIKSLLASIQVSIPTHHLKKSPLGISQRLTDINPKHSVLASK